MLPEYRSLYLPSLKTPHMRCYLPYQSTDGIMAISNDIP